MPPDAHDKRPFRVLYVSGENLAGAHGGTVHTRQVCRHLAQRRMQVDLLTHRYIGPIPAIGRNVRILRAPMRLRGRNVPLLGLLRLPTLLARRYDLIFERATAASGAGLVLSKIRGTPLVLELIGPAGYSEQFRRQHGASHPWLARVVDRWLETQMRNARLIITANRHSVPSVYADKVHVLEHGADCEAFSPNLQTSNRVAERRRSLGLEDSFVVVMVGAFLPFQGYPLMPEVVESVAGAGGDIRFLFVGDGPGRASFEAEIQRRNVSEAVRCVGAVPPEEVPELAACGQVGLAPYDASGYGDPDASVHFASSLKIFEYMASGLPVIASDYPALRRVVRDAGAGAVVPPGDAKALATAIRALRAMPDNERRESGMRGRREVEEKYTWDRYADDLAYRFRDIASRQD